MLDRWLPILGALLVAWPAFAGGLQDKAEPAAQPSCAEAVVLKVQKRYEAVSDLTAEFRQTTRVASFGGADPRAPVQAAGGEVVFAKPGRMRWTYREPEPSLVVTDGTTLWLYDPGLQEVQKLAVGEAFLSGAAIQFLLGQGRILDDFEVRSEACEADRVPLTLLPREDATYERLEIIAGRETGEILETTVYDLLGNVTRVAFSNVRVNQGPPPATFDFVPPPEARVLELPAAQ